jgi:type I restriction enzyme R subunit
MPELDTNMLRPAQITAISGIEGSLAERRFDAAFPSFARVQGLCR